MPRKVGKTPNMVFLEKIKYANEWTKKPNFLVKERGKKRAEFDPDGTRTHNLRLRRPTPYPLGHRVCVGHEKFNFLYI